MAAVHAGGQSAAWPLERSGLPHTNTPVNMFDTVYVASGELRHYKIGFLHKACPHTAAYNRVGSSVQGMPARWKRKAGTDAAAAAISPPCSNTLALNMLFNTLT